VKRVEEATQIAFFQHARMRLVPGAFIFHIANQGKRSVVAGRILKSAGLVPGLPDVWTLLATAEGTIVRCIELKSERGRLSAVQKQTIAQLEACGVEVAVCSDLDSALACLERWEVIRGRTRGARRQ
jgi:hypothetical protein